MEVILLVWFGVATPIAWIAYNHPKSFQTVGPKLAFMFLFIAMCGWMAFTGSQVTMAAIQPEITLSADRKEQLLAPFEYRVSAIMLMSVAWACLCFGCCVLPHVVDLTENKPPKS